MLRGMIAESGGDFVVIVLLTGETRKIPAGDVTYAGPASSAPGAAMASPEAAPSAPRAGDNGVHPFAVVHAEEARVSFVSVPKGSSLSHRSGSATFAHTASVNISATGYDEICTAPCVASMPAGTHTFAVAKPGNDPIEAKPVTIPAGSSTLTAKYVDKTGNRIGLIVVGSVIMIGGIALEGSAVQSSDGHVDSGVLLGGAALLGGGLAMILCVRFVKDGFELSIAPGAGAVLPPGTPKANNGAHSELRLLERPSANSAGARDGLAGLHLTARF